MAETVKIVFERYFEPGSGKCPKPNVGRQPPTHDHQPTFLISFKSLDLSSRGADGPDELGVRTVSASTASPRFTLHGWSGVVMCQPEKVNE
jgi:hypothetical protein